MDFNIYTDYGRSTCRLGVYRGQNCLIFENNLQNFTNSIEKCSKSCII